MRCRRCREQAVIEVRRHNAAYCKTCFVHVFRGQVTKAIEQFDMLQPSDRILVAVSGGKDSLALWDVLLDLGYDAAGLYLGLGIGGYSERSHSVATVFAARRDATLLTVDLASEYGYDIPTGGQRGSRSTCAVCGLSKRYVFNKVAVDGDFDVIATGHNLDDEAATLLGNTLRWKTEYIARQSPVLAAKSAMVKKVKPLVRLSELETAAYAFIRDIDYIVEECPLVAGNTQLRYKDAMNTIESASPGTKTQFFLGYLERGMPLFRGEDRAETSACERCGQPTTGMFCGFCRARAQILGERLRSRADAGDAADSTSTTVADTRQIVSELSDEVLPAELYEAQAR